MSLDGYDTFAQGVFNQFNAIMDTELSHEVRLVAFHRLRRDNQHFRYFLRAMLFCQQLEYLTFAPSTGYKGLD